MVDPLSERLGGVHVGLAWELAPGRTSQHLLVVSPEGDPELRAVARRWLRAAPAPDAVWEYADSRQPSADLADLVLDLNGVALPLGELAVRAAPVGPRLDVTLFHAALLPLPEAGRRQVAFLALDSALGETAVETWVGGIEVADEPPSDAVPLGELRGLVDAHRAEHVDADGNPTWQLLRGDGPRGPVLVASMVPLAATVAAHLDEHVAVTVPYAGRTEQGFPDEAALAALRGLEDHVAERLGGSGAVVAHETSAGERTLHFYVDSTGPGADVVRAAVTGWPDGPVRVTSAADPGWRAVRDFG